MKKTVYAAKCQFFSRLKLPSHNCSGIDMLFVLMIVHFSDEQYLITIEQLYVNI